MCMFMFVEFDGIKQVYFGSDGNHMKELLGVPGLLLLSVVCVIAGRSCWCVAQHASMCVVQAAQSAASSA